MGIRFREGHKARKLYILRKTLKIGMLFPFFLGQWVLISAVIIGQDPGPSCVATMRANGHKVLGGDIRDIGPAGLLEQARMMQGDPFLICGGATMSAFFNSREEAGYQRPTGKPVYGFYPDDWLYPAPVLYYGGRKGDYVCPLEACTPSRT